MKNIIENEHMHFAKYESNVAFSVLKFDIFFSSTISIKQLVPIRVYKIQISTTDKKKRKRIETIE